MNAAGNKRRIAALGECMIELREAGDGSLSSGFAGDTLNTATYLRRLLPADAFDVDYVTALGDDPFSERMLAVWRADGLGTDLVRRLPGALPGLYWILVDEAGERDFHYWRSAAAARRVLDDDYATRIAAALAAGDWLYVSGISFAILPPARRDELVGLLDTLRANGVRIAYDSNYRARLWQAPTEAAVLHERVLVSVDLLITSHVDESAMFGDDDLGSTVSRIETYAIEEWIVRGDPGVTVTRADGERRVRPIAATRVIDTTAAGDAFDAGYLAARLAGADSEAAIGAAHALAAVVVQQPGAIIPREATPTLESVLGATR